MRELQLCRFRIDKIFILSFYFTGLSVAFGFRYGVVHHVVHGQDHHWCSFTELGLIGSERPGYQEQRRPRKNQEKDQRTQSSQ